MRRMHILALVLFASNSAASEKPPLISGEMGASWLANSGNTNNSTLGLWGKLSLQPGPYVALAQGGYISSTVEQKTSSRRAYASVRGERTLPFRLSADVRGEYYSDEPAGTRHQFAYSAGLLCRVLVHERRTLAISASLTQTQERRVLPPNRDFLGIQAGLEFSVRFNPTVMLSHETSYVYDAVDTENWRVKASTSFQASLHRHVAVKISHQLYRNKPDPGKRAFDTGVVASLVASWPGTSP